MHEVKECQENANKINVLNDLAFRLMKQKGISITKARDEIAKEFSFKNWQTLLSNLDKVKELQFEKKFPNETSNNAFLSKKGIDRVALWPTPVGLRKSILDATAPLRLLLKESGIHDYTTQNKGQENKKFVLGYLVGDSVQETRVSLYRPETKKGDPRIWFSKLSRFASAGAELAVTVNEDTLFVFNLSAFNYENLLEQGAFDNYPKVLSLFSSSFLSTNALELLEKFKKLGVIHAPHRNQSNKDQKRDTDVGMAIEAAIGIAPNSAKQPDYKGIELKAWRNEKKNRHTLFTQIPSKFLDSRISSMCDFAALVGYAIRKAEVLPLALKKRADAKDLRCTVSAVVPNSQNLMLRVDNESDELIEFRDKEDLLLWTGKDLRKRLVTKHPETFWISCKTLKDNQGLEAFKVEKIYYTRSPLHRLFLSLIEQGKITLDHLCSWHIINKGSPNPKVGFTEKGPSFKIRENDLRLLFPDPIEIDI